MNYQEYLKTDAWRKKAEERRRIDNNTCQMCGCYGTQVNPLMVHHFNYHKIYHENVEEDLVTLCKSCHFGVHRMMNRITNVQTGERGWKHRLTCASYVFTVFGEKNDCIVADSEERKKENE